LLCPINNVKGGLGVKNLGFKILEWGR
jgi:hypothetical protein